MWKGNSRSLAVISIFLCLIFFVEAQTIEVDYPKEVELNEEFDFEISLNEFTDGAYDVKIDILQSEKRISKIFDQSIDNFKSTHYYLLNAIKSGEKSKEFKLKIESSEEGSADIVIKIRRNGETQAKTFEGYQIDIESKSNNDVEEEEIEEKDEQEIRDNEEEKPIIQETNEIVNISQDIPKINDKQEVIYLVPQSINNDSEIIFRSKNAKIAHYSIYGFALFCIFLMILLVLDKR